jgi:hypothetical protein
MPACSWLATGQQNLYSPELEVHGQPRGAVRDGLGLLLDVVPLDIDGVRDLRRVLALRDVLLKARSRSNAA